MASQIPLPLFCKMPFTSSRCRTACWNVRFMFWVTMVILIVAWPDTAHAECKKINNCKCKLDNGKVIDLSSIGNEGGSVPKFDYELAVDDISNLWEFSFNGCYGYSDAYCTNNVACQRSTDHSVMPGFALGTPDTADFTDGTLLKFNALQGKQQRYTEVKLICDENAESPILKRLGEPNYDWVYKYELTSKCACGNGCGGGGGGGGGGLSFGSILCILFPLVVLTYLVVGILFMKFVRGAEGKEMVPNVKVWMEFPFLVKDGALYAVSIVKPGDGGGGGKNSYDEL